MKAKNIWGENIDEVSAKFSQSVADGFTPTLAIIFCSITQDRKSLVDFFSEKNIEVFGSTTAGEIIDDEVMEHTSVIMLLDMKKDNFTILSGEGSDTYKISNDIAKKRKKNSATPALLLFQAG